MKRNDWADKAALDLFDRFDCFGDAFHGTARDATIGELAILFRAADRRGFKRAVKLLREAGFELPHYNVEAWLEEQERK